MATDSIAAFIETLRDHRLLHTDQLDQLTRYLQVRFSDARGLAKYLVQLGWLTVYQINQVFQGHAASLVKGPYRIFDRLGEGGISQVFKAWDTRQGCVVALKVIRPQHLSNPESVGRFHREIRLVTQLAHPNIVKAFDASLVEDTHFLAMEYIEGTDLQKLVQLSGFLPAAQACDYARQAALGLHHAFERGLVHRDIKPGNLLVCLGGSQVASLGLLVKILDMGLARLQQPSSSSELNLNLTFEGSLIGTADYLSPEQARNARKVDIRSDIYSLGCTLYYLLTAQPPFPGGTAIQKVFKHQQVEPTPVEELRPDLPKALPFVLRKMMAKDPDQRFQTPAEVADILETFCRPSKAVSERKK